MNDSENSPLDDEETFALFKQGRTGGVFSFGTREMAERARDFQPTTIEDIVALLALHHMRNEDEIAAYVRGRMARSHVPTCILRSNPFWNPPMGWSFTRSRYRESGVKSATCPWGMQTCYGVPSAMGRPPFSKHSDNAF